VAVVGLDPGTRSRVESLLRAAGLSVLSGDDLETALSGTRHEAPRILLVRTMGLADRAEREMVEEIMARGESGDLSVVELSGGETEGGPVARPALELIARVMEALGERPISP
jgi:hypothetical protein